MKILQIAIVTALMGSGCLLQPAFAQNTAPMNSSQADAMSSRNDPGGPGTPAKTDQPESNQHQALAQKIRQDLQNAGFTDVNVVAESYVVQAKTRDGNPVVMTIGPQGMSVFEALNMTGTSGQSPITTGQGSGATNQPGAAADQKQPLESQKMGGGNEGTANSGAINSGR